MPFPVKSPLTLYLHSIFILRSPLVHFRSLDHSRLIYSYVTAPRENLSYFPLHVDNDTSFVLLLHFWSWNLYSRSTLIMKFVLSLHIDHEIIFFCRNLIFYFDICLILWDWSSDLLSSFYPLFECVCSLILFDLSEPLIFDPLIFFSSFEFLILILWSFFWSFWSS